MKKTNGILMALIFTAAQARGAGTAAADFLKVSPDSRSAALGNTGAADPANGFAAFLNPALPAASADTVRVSAGQTKWILDTQVSHYAAAVRREVRGGAWGAALTMSQWDLPSFNTTDASGNATGSAAYGARSVGLSLSRAWGGRFSAGFGVKQITHGFQGGVSETGSALAYDAGIYARGERGGWNAGLVLQNAGGKSTLGAASEKLPASLRAGLELRPSEGRFSWTAEAVQSSEGGVTAGAGVGFSPLASMTLRAGYDSRVGGGEYAGLTSGVGVKAGSFSLDYAFSPFGELGSVQRISATWAYGGARRPAAHRRDVRKDVRRAVRAWETKYRGLR